MDVQQKGYQRDEALRRLEIALRQLLNEERSFRSCRGLLIAAAARARLDLSEVMPTLH